MAVDDRFVETSKNPHGGVMRMGRAPGRVLAALLGCFSLATAALLLIAGSIQPVAAEPHTLHTGRHPFDPDWPDVYMITSAKCAACHRPGADIVDLSSYEAIVDGRTAADDPIVVPGDPDGSMLFDYVRWNHAAKLDSDEPDSPMMPSDHEEWLTGGQLEIVRRWIENGALEYKLPATCSPRPLLEMDFPSAKECRTCHPKQYEEWSRSMHAYAEHSPIMEAFNLTLIERTGGTIGTFCTRCHTPLGTAMGENGSRRNVHRSRLSMEGVTCVVCHRVKKPYYKANARLAIQPGKLTDTCMYGPFDDPVAAQHGAHPATGRPHYKTSAFCGTCHDVTNPQGIRLEEAFSEWQNSPAARAGQTCQSCHMGPVPGVPIPDEARPWGHVAEVPGVDPELLPLRPLSDHTFTGPDYSMLPDTEFPHKLDWMYEIDYRDPSCLTPYQRQTLTELRRTNREQLNIAAAKRYELLSNAARLRVSHPETARAGERIRVRVDVVSIFGGHSFPTGFTAERQAWVHITLQDSSGRVVFASGELDENGDLRDEHSHEVIAGKLPYDRHLFNLQNKFIVLSNRGTERPVVIPVNRDLTPLNVLRPAAGISASYGRPLSFRIAKGSLPPLATLGQTYPIRLSDCPGDYVLRVRLNFRHLPPVLLDEIGAPHLKHLLEIVTIDEYVSVIRVSSTGAD